VISYFAHLLNRSGLQLGAQGGSAPQLLGKRGDRAQGGGTDVVLHAFDILMYHSVVNTEQFEKFGEQLVPLGDSASQFFSGAS
jgi:hypothetical protein